ncbi:unnamed protein product, partial [Callosobruchus maculatus]
MENGESPLDVLSTVASIVQESQTPLSPSPSPTVIGMIPPRKNGRRLTFALRALWLSISSWKLRGSTE